MNSEHRLAGFYMDPFYPLDNFSAFRVAVFGRSFDTSEHAYQYAKFLYPEDELARFDADKRGRIAQALEAVWRAPSAHDAKKAGAEYKDVRNPKWDDTKVAIMKEVLVAKYDQHEYVRLVLERSGGTAVVELSPDDDFWGWGPGRDGENRLGEVWMEIRLEKLGLQHVDYRTVSE